MRHRRSSAANTAPGTEAEIADVHAAQSLLPLEKLQLTLFVKAVQEVCSTAVNDETAPSRLMINVAGAGADVIAET